MATIYLRFPINDRAQELGSNLLKTVRQNNPNIPFPKKFTFGGDYSGMVWIQYKRNDVRDAIVEQAKKANVFDRID